MSLGVEQRPQCARIVGDDAVGAELEQTRGLIAIVDGPEVDAQADAVALGDEGRSIEPDPPGVRSLARRAVRRRRHRLDAS